MSGLHSRLFAVALLACTAMVLAEPAFAQSNNNDYTPLNSRIRRERQFPLEPQNFYEQRQLSEVGRSRSRSMVAQFGRCMWDRSNEDSLAFLARTDLGFVNFEQIGMTNEDVLDNFPISTCLDRVARNANSGVNLHYTHAGIRQWLLEAAYIDKWENGPTWLQQGGVVAARTYPVSANYPQVQASLIFADCVVAANPVDADYMFRTGESSEEERVVIQRLLPAIQGCLPQGQQMEINPFALRVWLGEGLWHAANTIAPPPLEATPEAPQEAQ